MKTSKTAVFLFELMIIILIFTLASAVCTQIFASSFNMSKESRELTMSSINAQTIAEQFKSGASDIEPLYFDKSWAPAGSDGAYYRVELDEQNGMLSLTNAGSSSADTVSAESNMREAYVNVFRIDGEEAIYTLHVKEFIG